MKNFVVSLCSLWGFICLFFSNSLFAQLHLTPLPHPTLQNATATRTENSGCPNDTLRLKLPFFDDFSQTKNGIADTSRWQCGSGVFINNTMATRTASFNMASFDGIAANGKPYNFDTPVAVGITDVLTSKPMDMRNNSGGFPKVVLSFYLQPQGYGERPDKGDVFQVLGKTVEGRWDIIRQYEARDDWKEFEYQSIPVIDAKFFHIDFQLRFQIVGRQSGLYDVWNLDYVYLDNNRDASRTSVIDLTMSIAPDYLLKDYTAMPITHFYEKTSLLRDTINATMNQLDNQNPNPVFYNVILSDVLTKAKLGNLLVRDSSILAKTQQIRVQGFPFKFPNIIPKNRTKLYLKTDFQLNTGEKIATLGINTLTNDTLSTTTVLDNYYAYDDGSAEYGVSFNQKFGKIACEFDNAKADFLTHIDIYFPQLGVNLSRETYNLYVWQKVNIGGGSNKDSTLLVQNIILNYSDSLNKYTRIPLNRVINLKTGKFYIGVEQLSDKNLTLGFDKNIDNTKKIYVNVNNQWLQPQNISGSLMIRPVFRPATVTAADDNIEEESIATIYPNPTSGAITIAGKSIEKIQIYNSVGQFIAEQTVQSPESVQFELSHLPTGLYLVYLQSKDKVEVKKLVINR